MQSDEHIDLQIPIDDEVLSYGIALKMDEHLSTTAAMPPVYTEDW